MANMRWLLALACVIAMIRTALAVPPAFDLGACALDLAPGSDKPATLGDLAPERGGPPPAMTQLPLVSAQVAAETAAKLVAKLPAGFAPRIELDAAQMAAVVELHLPGVQAARQLAPDILAFVRLHPCLFGVIDPGALGAHATGPNHEGTWVLIELRPRSVGALQAEVTAERTTTRVRIDQHLWPIADATPTIDPKRMLARYLGIKATRRTGWRYLIDPRTRRHRGCVPIYRDVVTDVSAFHLRAGPILACERGAAVVRSGAFVWSSGFKDNPDAALAELPTALMPDGTRIASFIAPALREPADDTLATDFGRCP